MKPIRLFCLTLLNLMMAAGPVPAQTDLAGLLPVYSGSQVSALPSDHGESLVITTSDDPKAVMIYFRKMLAYDGWQALDGRVLKGDRTIVFKRNAQHLMMTDATPTGSTTRIIFSLAE